MLNEKNFTGPFDVIGDVHGCFGELSELLDKLGYTIEMTDGGGLPAYPEGRFSLCHPEDRLPVFLGDLFDRGPDAPKCFSLVSDACENGSALCVCGNHEGQLLRRLKGESTMFMYGLDETVEQLEAYPREFIDRAIGFMEELPYGYTLDGGRLVIVHAGLIGDHKGIDTVFAGDYRVYGDTAGENRKYGLPDPYDWVSDYHGEALVVYGHIPTPEAKFLRNTICIDTGCVYGGSLTAYRYPEGGIVSVPAKKKYFEPARPIEP